MKADTVDLAAVFGKPVHYVVPLYQRPYVWDLERQWEPLWQDVRDVAERQLDDLPANDAIPHFLGAVVLEQALVQTGKIDARSIIDGQQRLTTLQLIIAAARSVALEHGLDNARQAFEKLLFNESFLAPRKGDEFKVFPTERDRAAFNEALHNGVAALTGGHRLHEAYRYFRGSVRQWVTDGADASMIEARVEALSTAIWKRLVLVTIDLDPGDNAQVIFETLNARGTPLLAADLIKNHLFQTATLQGADVGVMWEEHWKGLDTDWWREEVRQGRLNRPRLDIFLNHWLAMSTGREVVSAQLFPEFKRYLAAGQKRASDVLADIARYGRVYETFEHEAPTTDLGRFLYRLNAMEVTTAYPALLWLLGPDGLADTGEMQAALGAIESWLVRRMLTRQTTKNYNTVFLSLLSSVRRAAGDRGSAPCGSDVVEFLAGLNGESQYWPHAGQVQASVQSLPAYSVFSQGRLRMVLEALELGLRTALSENVPLPGNLTIEHVLPQEWRQNWPLPEDVDPLRAGLDRDAAKHRLGNLTLVTGSLNSKQSNAGWDEKRKVLQQHSVMRLSSEIVVSSTWDEAAIAARGERLALLATQIWTRPHDSEDDTLGSETEVAGERRPGGPPDPVDPVGFASPLAIADDAGVGPELRRIVEVSREIGLYPRPDRYGVMVAPRADRRVYLLTVKPQPNDGGSFRIWKSPTAFARWIPTVTLDRARTALGESEEPGVLLRADTPAFLTTVRGLIPDYWSTGSFEERRTQLLDLGIEGLARVPEPVLRTIDGRAGGDPEIALRFAAAALAIDGVTQRPQQSKGEPWYFQVRHPRFSQVLAYAWPQPGELRAEYRLPGSHETYGLATSRDGFYGIVLTICDDKSLEVALRLLADAVAAPK